MWQDSKYPMGGTERSLVWRERSKLRGGNKRSSQRKTKKAADDTVVGHCKVFGFHCEIYGEL